MIKKQTKDLKAPFSYFGGKSRVTDIVWERFGDVTHYIEPFFGSGAVLLQRPGGRPEGAETINDFDGFVCNFWRAVKWAPDELAEKCEWPIIELDQNSRRDWLVENRDLLTQKLREDSPIDWMNLSDHLREDSGYYNIQAAAWWVWGSSMWIGKGWPNLDSDQMPKISSKGADGVLSVTNRDRLDEVFNELQERMKHVRVLCGDWSRLVGSKSALYGPGDPVGIFLDPPYPNDAGSSTVYALDSDDVAYEVGEWCKENGNDERLRIALCGYEGTYDLPDWECVPWKAQGGYGNQAQDGENENANRERIWFSPGCLTPEEQFRNQWDFDGV